MGPEELPTLGKEPQVELEADVREDTCEIIITVEETVSVQVIYACYDQDGKFSTFVRTDAVVTSDGGLRFSEKLPETGFVKVYVLKENAWTPLCKAWSNLDEQS